MNSSVVGQACSLDITGPILDNTQTNFSLVVEGATNNDLSTFQGVCFVELEFEHEFVADITIELISPSGQIVQLVGPGVLNSSFTSNINWNVDFVSCAAPAVPDIGFNSTWNNLQNWGVGTAFNGSYYPNAGCLEDFNTGPVNGTWTIRISDVSLFGTGELLGFSILFCDPTGIDCSDCQPDAGSLNSQDLSFCESAEALNLEWEPSYGNNIPDPTVYDYLYVVSSNDQIVDYLDQPDLITFQPGEYSICGLSLLSSQFFNLPAPGSSIDQLEAQINEGYLCAELNPNCSIISIQDIPDTLYISQTICKEDTLKLHGLEFFEDGIYNFTNQNNLCDSAFVLELEVTEHLAFIDNLGNDLSCNSPFLELDGSLSFMDGMVNYFWLTPNGNIDSDPTENSIIVTQPGEYFLILEGSGCADTTSIQVSADNDFPAISLVAPPLDCATNTTTINLETTGISPIFNWEGPSFNSSSEDVTVNGPGLYQVTVTSINGCTSYSSINIEESSNIVDPEFSIETLNCEFAERQVKYNVDTAGNTYQWSGPNGFNSNIIDPIITNPGIYEVTITSSTMCVEIFTLEVLQDLEIYNISVELDTITCINSPVELSVSSLDPNSTYQWTDQNLTTYDGQTISTDVSGFYEIAIIQTNGCQKDTMVEVLLDIAIPTVTTMDQTIDCGVDSIQLSPIYGNTVSEINWSGPADFVSNEAMPWIKNIGEYLVTVIAENGCEYTESLIVSEGLGVPVINIMVDTINCANSSVQINHNLNNGYTFQWEGPNMFTSNDPSPIVSEGGIYSVIVTDTGSNCSSRVEVEVVVDTLAPSPNILSNNITCTDPNPIVEFTSTQNLSSWQWTSPSGVITNNATILVDDVGWYVWEGIGENFCFAKDSVEVILDDQNPVIETRDTFINCLANSVFLPLEISSPFAQVNWSGPGFTSAESNPDVTQEGKYYVEVIGDNGCSSYDSLVVVNDRIPPALDLVLSNDLSCTNPTASITAMSPEVIVDYAWVGPNSQMFSSQNINISQAGWYYVTIYGENNCSTIDSVEVLLLDVLPDVNAIASVINCQDQESNVSVEHLEINPTILWQGPNGFSSASENFQTMNPGIYYVTITDDQGCSGIDSVAVIEDVEQPMNSIVVSDTLDCNISSVEIEVISNPQDSLYQWVGPDNMNYNTQIIDVSQAGMYSLIVTGKNHCTAQLSSEVIIDTSQIDLTLVASDINCVESKVTLEVSSDQPIIEVQWFGPLNFSSSENPTLTFSTGYHYAEVISDNGCSTLDSILVQENFETPDVIVEDIYFECFEDSATLMVETTQTNISYQWYGPNDFYSEDPSPVVSETGEYIVATNLPNGCIRLDTFELIKYPEVPDFDAFGGEITCSNPSVQLNTDIVDYLSIQWTGPNGFSSNTPNPVVTEAGSYDLQVITLGDCVHSRQAIVTVDTIHPLVSIDPYVFLLCEIVEVNLDATNSDEGPEYEINWSTDTGNFLSDESTLFPLVNQEGTYTLSIKNLNNDCVSTEDVFLEQRESDLTIPLIFANDPLCLDDNNGSISIGDVQGGISPYLFSFNQGPFEVINDYENLISGNYLVAVQDSAGCVYDQLITLNDGFNLQVHVGSDTTLLLGESLDIIPQLNENTANLMNIQWQADQIISCENCFENTFLPLLSGPFEITVENNQNCVATDELYITVDENIPIYIPNVFSPDGDGINDLFLIRDNGGIREIKSFDIFDRWGNKVFSRKNFQSNDESFSWDGKFKGEYLIPGVYVYLIEYELINGSTAQKSGDVTIFR